MRLSSYLPVTLAILLGGAACFGVAVASVSAVETQSRREVTTSIVEAGHDWADVDVDGLQVILTGTAPTRPPASPRSPPQAAWWTRAA
jgi:OmpA-OmpF porin, OOP family